MKSGFATRQREWLARHFAARTAELALVRRLLASRRPTTQVLYLHGPGGIGKSALMWQLGELARKARRPLAELDARTFEATPDELTRTLAKALGLRGEPLGALARLGPAVILLDTCERLVGLDSWLRAALLPALPPRALLVLATRVPPSAAWIAEPGWGSLIQPLALSTFAPRDSHRFLAARDVPRSEHAAMTAFTRGHPLALALAADSYRQRPRPFQPESTPEVVQALIEHLVGDAPSNAHRLALDACAVVRTLSEPLLAAMLGIDDAQELYDWLGTLSCIEQRPGSHCPHDLARDVLVASLRRRRPDQLARLIGRAHGWNAARLLKGSATEATIRDDMYLHRHSSEMAAMVDGQQGPELCIETATAADVRPVRALVARHEGEASARIAEHWLARQRLDTTVVRDGTDGERGPAGFLTKLDLGRLDQADLAIDPGARAASELVASLRPRLGRREVATLFRFWMARDHYQDASRVQSLIMVQTTQHALTTPGFRVALLVFADPDRLADLLRYTDMERWTAADFTVGDRRYGVWGRDWKTDGVAAWLGKLAQQAAARLDPAQEPSAHTPARADQRAAFLAMVKQALRNHARPHALIGSELLGARLVQGRSGAGSEPSQRVPVLRTLLREAVAALATTPRGQRCARVLELTYLDPAPTQEDAAHRLGMSFSTYRRCLAEGIAHLGESLWQAENQPDQRNGV